MATTLIEERNRAIIDALAECVESCSANFYRCNVEHGSMAECSRLCADCADICGLVHKLLSRESPWAAPIARVAAQVSAKCAAECGKNRDKACMPCEEICGKTAKLCEELAER
jgi:hypothetical protein